MSREFFLNFTYKFGCRKYEADRRLYFVVYGVTTEKMYNNSAPFLILSQTFCFVSLTHCDSRWCDSHRGKQSSAAVLTNAWYTEIK